MRNISFAMTLEPFMRGEKTVTRRLGWKDLQPGDRLMAVMKSQGLKKGEKIQKLDEIEVLSVRRERLDQIDSLDVAREGYPGMLAWEFVMKFCDAMGCGGSAHVTRIEFRRIPDPDYEGGPGA